MEALRKALRNTDFYRKVPRDLKGQRVGVRVFHMRSDRDRTFVLELRAYLTVTDDVIMADAGLKHSLQIR